MDEPKFPEAWRIAELDAPLKAIGFEYETLTPERLSGRFVVAEKCCQPFKILHGGVSALIAEAMASMGACIASGLQKVAGIQLCINHLKPAKLGDLVLAQAFPINIGKNIQVWEARLWKVDDSKAGDQTLLSMSRVTLLSSASQIPQRVPDSATLKKHAKL